MNNSYRNMATTIVLLIVSGDDFGVPNCSVSADSGD
jgi:hypothetical protein